LGTSPGKGVYKSSVVLIGKGMFGNISCGVTGKPYNQQALGSLLNRNGPHTTVHEFIMCVIGLSFMGIATPMSTQWLASPYYVSLTMYDRLTKHIANTPNKHGRVSIIRFPLMHCNKPQHKLWDKSRVSASRLPITSQSLYDKQARAQDVPPLGSNTIDSRWPLASDAT
jgi:uncharacterized membrane protein YeaQ/YmgE (transglycosylase-associated protein family)